MDNKAIIDNFKNRMIAGKELGKFYLDNSNLDARIYEIYGKILTDETIIELKKEINEYVTSGEFSVQQYFYTTKELSDKKAIFAEANWDAKKKIFNSINKDDKEALINNNEHITIKDIYEILTISKFESEEKKEIVNLLDDLKIKKLKDNYIDIDESLKNWLDERYEQIFGKTEIKDIQQTNPENTVNNIEEKDTMLIDYKKAQDKVRFFNSIANMQEKQKLFSKLDKEEKSNLLNDKNTNFLKSFYNNYQNKEELLSLMNYDNIKNLYSISNSEDKNFISNFLYKVEQTTNNSINENLSNINKETQNITNYHQSIEKSKENISNLKNEKKEIRLNINNSKVIIKQLEKRKEKLEKKLAKAVLKKDSRIAFISKKRLEKINQISSEIKLTNININDNQETLNNYNQQLNTIKTKMKEEKDSIKNNKKNISLANSKIKDYAKEMYNSRVEVKEVSAFHKELIGKKAYKHNKNNMVMITSKEKTENLINNQEPQQEQQNLNDSRQNDPNVSTIDNNIQPNNEIVSQDNSTLIRQEPSQLSQKQKNIEKVFNEMGLTYNHEEFVDNTQNPSYVPMNAITSMSVNQAKMLQLYFEAQFAKKMVEMAKMQQQMAMEGRTRTYSKAGFSNILILVLSLVLLLLVGAIIFLIINN